MMPPSLPVATYRLQLTAQFGFYQAAAIVPYLKALGISHVYASPFLKARSGSSHGYDVVDHNAVNPELGGEEGLDRLCAVLAAADMGLILDFVPNHMGIHHADNPWWLDVLEGGPKSVYAPFFDIDWQGLQGHPGGGVLLPLLGNPYGDALHNGEVALRYEAGSGSFSAWYYEHRLPISPVRYSEVLQRIVAHANARDTPAGSRLLEFAERYRGPHNPPRQAVAAFKAELAGIAGGGEVIARGLAAYDPKSGEPEAVLALHRLLERQHYRLAYWRLAGSEINYRRFFDINDLAALRVENRDTFLAIHRLVRRLIAQGRLRGLRIDHIDGLRDPHQYFRRLARLIEVEQPPDSGAFYVIAEKILAEGEHLPRFAGVSGTTGYEWLNLISRLLLDERGLALLDDTWREVTGDSRAFAELLADAKRRVIATILASEFTVLSRLLARLAHGHYSTRDYASERLRAAFELFIIHFPVYRTYITASGPSREDRAIIERAIEKARAQWFGPDISIFDFLRDALTLDLIAAGHTGYSIARSRQFAFKVQQFTGPMMAKSLEDTAFYRYHRLLALNEVGGSADAGAISIAGFHARMQERGARLSLGLTATATHDTKRGEDARARLLALTELAAEWQENIREWRKLTADLIPSSVEPREPTVAHEYMIYQALLGAWPLTGLDRAFIERVEAYAIKAAREGKQQTSWLSPNEHYETALKRFVRQLLDPNVSAAFLAGFDAFARRVALIGALNSITQLVLKATMPGVPDFYQGTEFWDLSFVDPDNRWPVDFHARAAALNEIEREANWPVLADAWRDGRIKLALTRRLLALRGENAELFARGSYYPIAVVGEHSDEIIAFARVSGRDAVVVVLGRLFRRATDHGRHWPSRDAWQAALMLEGFDEVKNLAGESMAGRELPVVDLFGPLPFAILKARHVAALRPQRTHKRARRSAIAAA
jgi:(1->4)-alpha-D-glucan 1-alpha-D-glucosylmutase